MRRRRARGALIGLAVAATSGIVVSDSSNRFLSPFWRSHAMISAVVSGVLFILIASVVVEALIDVFERRRWHAVAGVTYRSLAVAMGRLRRTLDGAVTGAQTTRLRVDPGLAEEISSAIKRNGPSLAGCDTRSAKLLVLVDDPIWVKHVRVLLVDEKDAGRDLLAKWIPLILASGEYSGDLSRLAEVNDAVSDLEKALSRYRGSPLEKAELVVGWRELIEEIVSNEQRFARLAGLGDWNHRSSELPP